MEATKRCPLCAEVILAMAVRCKHCQADLRFLTADPAPFIAAPLAPPIVQPRPAAPLAPQFISVAAPVAAPASVPASASALVDGPPHVAVMPAVPPADVETRAARGPRADEYVPPAEGDFEQRFLDFAFKTTSPINGASVAYALKVPIDEAVAQLEDLAARDILIREVDARGSVFFQLPGRPPPSAAQMANHAALVPYAQPPALLYESQPGALMMRTPTESTALVGLLVNALCPPPGIGSLIGGKTSAGVFQILFFVVGLAFCATGWMGMPVGIPMIIASWIWGLVTGVSTLNEAKQGNAQPHA